MTLNLRPLFGACVGSSAQSRRRKSLPIVTICEPVVGCSHFAYKRRVSFTIMGHEVERVRQYVSDVCIVCSPRLCQCSLTSLSISFPNFYAVGGGGCGDPSAV